MKKFGILALTAGFLMTAMFACKKVAPGPDGDGDGNGDDNNPVVTAMYVGTWEGTEAHIVASPLLDSTMIFSEGDFQVEVMEDNKMKIVNNTGQGGDVPTEIDYTELNDSTIKFHMEIMDGVAGDATMTVTAEDKARIDFYNSIEFQGFEFDLEAEFLLEKK